MDITVEKMDPAIKKNWLKALRSGEYEQGSSFLKAQYLDGRNEHCCLGVLCEIYSKAHPEAKFEKGEHVSQQGDKIVHKFLGSINGLPSRVIRWSGLETTLGPYLIEGPMGLSNLAGLNDNGWTFEQIAEIIEKKL